MIDNMPKIHEKKANLARKKHEELFDVESIDIAEDIKIK